MKLQDKPDYLIFASDAKTGELQTFPDVARGWGLTTDETQSKPPLGWMNGAFNRVDKNILYLLQQGVPEWESSILYPADAIVKYNHKLYIALAENDDTVPSNNPAKWDKLIKDTPVASTAEKGIVQLSSAINSDSEVTAATSKAVKTAYDLINQTLAKRVPIVGEFKLFPFRASELPPGWYFRNGDQYLVTSEVGKALKSLSFNFKADWRIFESGGYINLPTAFASDGRGLFERSVDGKLRGVGSIQGDSIRNITGTFPVRTNRGTVHNFSGAFYSPGNSWNDDGWSSNANLMRLAVFDASLVVPTADENRPFNIGLIPAIYLGV